MKSTKPQKSWIDTGLLNKKLRNFFKNRSKDLYAFGSTVNQVFEAFVFASVATWYRERGWRIEFVHPKRASGTQLRLKFSTRGRPENFSFVRCTKSDTEVHIRHQIRVATKHHMEGQRFRANIVLDVAVLIPKDVALMSSDDHMDNCDLVSFGEAKHMSAFAELVANFIGLVHELQPTRLKRIRRGASQTTDGEHPSPFLFVSGFLFHTAHGLMETIKRRGYDIDIFWRTNQLAKQLLVEGVIKEDAHAATPERKVRKSKTSSGSKAGATPDFRILF